MKKILILALFIAALGAGQRIFGQELENNCVMGASVTDTDPNGLNVRNKPSITGKIVTKLKHSNNEKYIVYVIGYSNGWVKIGGANDGTVDVSKAQGWVSAKMLSVTADGGSEGSAGLYLKPNREGKMVAKIPNGTKLQIAGFDCLSLKVAYQGQLGWLTEAKQ